ncbi:MAG: MotA/TolQ/ExbB proton channel family protein [Eubacteriales bacterium]|nr:MotA/TolQ/ExbB proton channel family protein [Eubacteriales bacterium]
MQFAEIIKNAFSAMNGITNALVYLAICALFVLGIVKCVAPVISTRGMLRRAARLIRQGNNAKHSWQEEKFLGKGALFPHWSEYLNNLFFADGEYHNASNVEDYINEETVIYGPGRQAFADAIPGLLVSLGFLGTLIGLAQGLSGFDMTDSSAVQASIVTLIPGMRYAFTTSIVGVVCSIAFTLISRSVNGSTQHALKSFYGAMSRYAGVLSVDPMTQIAIYQQEQTALIQTMAKDLNGAFTQHMAEAMAQTVEPIHQSLKNFITVSTKEQMRLLDAVAQRFVDRTEEMFQGELQGLSDVLSQTSRRQSEAFQAVDESMRKARQVLESVEKIGASAEELSDTFNAYIKSLSANQSQVDDAYVRISGNVERMDLISRQQTSYLKAVSSMQAGIAKSMDDMRQNLAEYTQAVSNQQASASETLSKTAADLRQAGSEIAHMHAKTAESMDRELKDTLDAFAEYATQFNKRVDYLASSIANSLSQLPRAVDDTSAQLLDQVDRLGATLRDAQRALDDAVDRMYNPRANV